MTETLREKFHKREVQHVANLSEMAREFYPSEYERSPLHSKQDVARMRAEVSEEVERLKVCA